MSVRETFAAIVLATTAHMRANERGARERDDPEYIHQMRVGLRRLRSALSVFPATENADPARKETKWLASILGEARDWDVLADKTLREIESSPYEAPLPAEAHAAIARFHASARKRAQQTLRSARYRALRRRLSKLNLKQPARVDEPHSDLGRDVTSHAREVLGARYSAVQKRGRNLGERTADELHRLRIAMKKLRYTVEFFGSLFDAGAVTAFRRKLTAVQEVLGVLNDAATTHALAQKAFGKATTPALVEARGTLVGWSNGRLHTLRRDLKRHWKAFENTQTFW